MSWPYGLGGTAWTRDARQAMRMTRAIQAGPAGLNGYQREPNAPFGSRQPTR